MRQVAGGRWLSALAVTLLFLTLVALPAAAGEDAGYSRVEKRSGVLRCAAHAASVQTDNLCESAEPEPAPTAFAFNLPSNLSAILIELSWTPNNAAAGAQSLALGWAPVGDVSEAWAEGKSPLQVTLPVPTAKRNHESMSWTIAIRAPRTSDTPGAIIEQNFELVVTHFHDGLAPSEDSSALEDATPAGPYPNGPVLFSDSPPLDSGPGAGTEAAGAFASGDGVSKMLIIRLFGAASFAALVVLAVPRLRRFLLLGASVFYTRLQEDRVLEHPRRHLLTAMVRSQPGISSERLRVRAGLASGAFEHHVGILVARGIVRRERVENSVVFFPTGSPRAAAPAPEIASLRWRILNAVQLAPGERQVDLARRLRVPEKNVRYHALRLARSGKLRLVPDGRAVRCYPA